MRQYLKNLPSTKAEFERNNSIAGVQRELFTSALQGELTQIEIDQIAPLIRVIGFPQDYVETLISKFDVGCVSERESYLALMFHTPVGSKFFGSLPEKKRIILSGPWIRPMLRLADNGQEFPKKALVQIVKSTSKRNQALFREIIEEYRIALGCSLSVYDAFPQECGDEVIH